MKGLLLTNLHIGEMHEKQRINFGEFILCENMISKFRDDKLFIDSSNFICAIDGVILNKKELCEKYRVSSMQDLVSAYIKSDTLDFYKEFRGTFNGILFLKDIGRLVIFVDQYASKPIFYYCENNHLIIANVLKDLTDVLYENHCKCNVNYGSINDLLTYGFIIRNETIVEEVKRIPAGCSLTVLLTEERLENETINRYHQFSQLHENTISEKEAIEEIDRLFRKAICLEYEKDKEYGYKHITSLSAGLDSRMNNWVANDMGYVDILNITFSQVESEDMSVPSQIAEKLNHQWLFKSLNDATCMTSWEKMIPLINGLCNYWNTAHGFLLNELIDFTQYGLVHSGMIGDAIVASKFEEKRKYKGGDIGTNSSLAWDEGDVREDNTLKDETEELYFLYGRALQGANASAPCITYRDTESVSPFLYVDLVEYCFSLPQKMRYKHRIYMKWLLTKYPDAAEFLWNGIDIKEWVANDGLVQKPKKKRKRYLRKFRKMIKREGFVDAIEEVLCCIGIKDRKIKEKTPVRARKPITWGMNPVDSWYMEKPIIREKMDEYFEKSIKKYLSTELPLEKIKYVYDNGLAQDKAMCITVFATLDEFGYVLAF